MKLSQVIPANLDATLRRVLEELIRQAQGIQHEVRTVEPQLNDLQEGQLVLYDDGSSLWLYTKRQNKRYKIEWTGV